MSDPVEAFMSDIAFDDGMGFSLGIGGPSDATENARRRLAEYVKSVRRSAPSGKADEEEAKFRLALKRRVAAEIEKAPDARAKSHLQQVLATIKDDA